MKTINLRQPLKSAKQLNASKLGAQARRLQAQQAQAEKKTTPLTYTSLNHPRHAQILQSALTQCKQKLGLA